MRGIGNTQFFGSPGVQLYVDGVPQGNVFSYGSDLYDLAAVEVLKGPQGGRLGKLAPGGAINLITKKPGQTQTSKVSASYATFNTQKYNISSSGPMDEQFSYSLGVQRSSSDGFLNNTSGRDNDSESWNGRLSFHWDGGAGTNATLGASFTSHELGSQPLVLRNQADFYARSVDEDEFTEIDQNQQFLKLEHETDFGTITSVTSRNDWSMNPNKLDIDLNTIANVFVTQSSTISHDQRQFNQELSLHNDSMNGLYWKSGIEYSDNQIDGFATRDIGIGQSLNTNFSIDSNNISFFGLLSKSISDQQDITIDARIDNFDNSINRVGPQLTLPGFFPIVNVPYNLSKDDSLLSGSGTLSHEINPQSFIMGKVSYSQKPGGYSAFTNLANEVEYDEEKISSYELAYSSKVNENFHYNISFFFNQIDDYQFELNSFNPLGVTDYYLENADEVSIYGVEVDSIWNLGGGWSFGASYGLTESEFEKVTPLPALVGKQLPFVPDHSLSLVLGHKLNNGLSYQVGSRTTGKTFFWDNTGSNSEDVIDSFTLLEAQIGYTFNDWNINLFGSNLTNEEYYTNLVGSLKNPNPPVNITDAPGVVGSPRVIGLSISKEF
jgi:iron complex outermembrane receptor protein